MVVRGRAQVSADRGLPAVWRAGLTRLRVQPRLTCPSYSSRMALWMAWAVRSVAEAGGNMDGIEGAVAALDRSVQRILDRDPAMTGTPATALRASARDIRTRMLGEGR